MERRLQFCEHQDENQGGRMMLTEFCKGGGNHDESICRQGQTMLQIGA
jgi:hypothetical protein